jgi:hypothetical protein
MLIARLFFHLAFLLNKPNHNFYTNTTQILLKNISHEKIYFINNGHWR